MFGRKLTFEEARHRMVEKQLIKRGVKDARVLSAMQTIPRHLFVSKEHRDRAYADNPLPIEHNQTISQPYIVAHMTEMLMLPSDGRAVALEIGTGSGYQAAILSCLVEKVYTVERIPKLAETAQQLFNKLGLTNIEVSLGDGGYGWWEHAPYNAIITTAAAPDVPPPLVDQLADEGILIAPIGPRYEQYLVRLKRQGDKILKENLTRVAFVPFLGEHGWHS